MERGMGFWRTIAALALVGLLGAGSALWADSTPSGPAAQVCGPQTGTLGALNEKVTMPQACAGMGTYIITISTAGGDSPFVGTIVSRDATTGGGRRLHKTTVGALQVATETLNGAQGALEYRTCGGAGPQEVAVTAYTSGRATVNIYAMVEPTACFVNGVVQTAEEGALRAGRAFTASTGLQTITSGQWLSLLLTNPANSGIRLVIPTNNRIISCDNVSSALLPKYISLPNPTTNIPTSNSATVTRRGGTSGSPAATSFWSNAAGKPDTTPTTTNPIGLAFFGSYAVPQDRTLEPGASTIIAIQGVAVPSGLGTTNSTCSIIISWYEESIL